MTIRSLFVSACLWTFLLGSWGYGQGPVVVWVDQDAQSKSSGADVVKGATPPRVTRFPRKEASKPASRFTDPQLKPIVKLPTTAPTKSAVKPSTKPRLATRAVEAKRLSRLPTAVKVEPPKRLPAQRLVQPSKSVSKAPVKSVGVRLPVEATPVAASMPKLRLPHSQQRAQPTPEPEVKVEALPAPPREDESVVKQDLPKPAAKPTRLASLAKSAPLSKLPPAAPPENGPAELQRRAGIVFHPPQLQVGKHGELSLQPRLNVATEESPGPHKTLLTKQPVADPVGSSVLMAAEAAVLAPESEIVGATGGEVHFDTAYTQLDMSGCDSCATGNCAPGACTCGVEVNPVLAKMGGHVRNRIWGHCGCEEPYLEAGVGHEWLSRSPFVIQRAQPLNHYGFRFAAAYNHQFPDRSEFLWSKSPDAGPNIGVGEESVDYQDFRFAFETGGPRFSVLTEIPIRVLDPVLNQNTAGMGDMTLTTRTVLLDGEDWMITQVFNSYFNTGAATHGTGNGHISLEPGMLFRWEYSDFTHVHAEIKYLFPLGADADHAGEMLRYGLGLSKLVYDGDAFGIISTMELVSGTFLDGLQTLPGTTFVEEVDGIGYLNIHPGARFVFDSPGDWAQWDLGFSGGFAVTGSRMYDGIFMMDLRWAF